VRVLLTGNQGYIGTRLAPLLRSAGIEIRGYDNFLFRDCSILPLESVPTIVKDIRDAERADVEGCDAIIHLAGLSNDPLGDIDPSVTLQVNFEATVRLAEVARQAGVHRFLYASSCSVYGAAGEVVQTEDAEFNPVTPYGLSKSLAETELRKLGTSSFSPVFLRASTAYGVSPMIRFDLVLNNLVAWATATGKVFIKSDGTPWRPVVHVEDIGRAYIAALMAPAEDVHLQAFNVGIDTENYRVRELAEFVSETVPGAEIEYAADAGPDKRCYRASFEKISRVLKDYRPRWTARRGALEIYEVIRRLGLGKADFEGARYNRVNHLKLLAKLGQVDHDLRRTDLKSTGGLREAATREDSVAVN
jgi:nucleoside-diphosphate-sugar epimerase